MAMQITAKDRIFVMVVLPVAIALCYWYFVRKPVAAERQAFETRKMTLGEAEDLDIQKITLERRLKECRARYEEVLARPAETNALPKAETDFSARLKGVLGTFERSGVHVVKSEPVEAGNGSAVKGVAMETLEKAVPAVAVQRWQFELKATYGCLLQALSAFAEEDAAVICESLSMTPSPNGGPCSWTVTLCL